MLTKKNIIQRVDALGNIEKVQVPTQVEEAATSNKQTTTGAGTKPNLPTLNTETPTSSGYNYKAYSESPVVQEAYDLLQKHIGTTPQYTPTTDANGLTYKDKLTAQLEAILAGKDFKYDLNGDMLYQQYKDMYTNQAKMAMADTMGQAAAMTGGYGNSYAQTVGQQMYQQQMQGLNDMIPELYQMALDKHNMERQTMLDEYSLLADAENREYSKFMDEYNQWLSNRDYLANSYYNERNFDYTKHSDKQSYDYAKERDSAADKLARENADYEYKKVLAENGYTLDKDGNIIPIENNDVEEDTVDYISEAKSDIATNFGWDKKNEAQVRSYLNDLMNSEDVEMTATEALEIIEWWKAEVDAYKKLK